MAYMGKAVFAVEASHERTQHICASVLENRLQRKVTIIHNAIHRDTVSEYTGSNMLGSLKDGRDSIDVPQGNFKNEKFTDKGGRNMQEQQDIQQNKLANKGRNDKKQIFPPKTNKHARFGRRPLAYIDQPPTRGENLIHRIIDLDDLLSLEAFRWTKKVFLKINANGHEHMIVRESETFFKLVDVVGIYMEWYKHYTKSSANYIYNTLTSRGYTPFDCEDTYNENRKRIYSNKLPCTRKNENVLKKRINNLLWISNAELEALKREDT